MNIFDALFGRSSAPPMSVGEMVGGAAADPNRLMDQLANRERTAAVTNYMLQDSPFSQIVQAPVRGAMGVADVLTGQKPYETVYPDGSVRTSPQFIGDVADVAGSIGVGTYSGAPAGALGSGMVKRPKTIDAYHATFQPFDEYDFSRLGAVTRENTGGTSVEDWAMNLARAGAWSSDTPVASKMGATVNLPVQISGVPKKFSSLDAMERAVKKAGGPDKFREKMIADGFGFAQVKDEEFGVNSFVSFGPENFKVKK